MKWYKTREAALTLFDRIQADSRFIAAFPPELDILVWIPKATSASAASQLTRKIFAQAAQDNLHLAIANIPTEFFINTYPEIERDQDYVTCLRSCLMKPEHVDWIDHIWKKLDQATDKVLASSYR